MSPSKIGAEELKKLKEMKISVDKELCLIKAAIDMKTNHEDYIELFEFRGLDGIINRLNAVYGLTPREAIGLSQPIMLELNRKI